MDTEFFWFWNPAVPWHRLHVAVQDSRATITGSVRNARERRAAIRDAYDAGALDVFDHLKVES